MHNLFVFVVVVVHIGPKARLMLRYPDGQREQISLSSKAKLLVRTTIFTPFLSQLDVRTFSSCRDTEFCSVNTDCPIKCVTYHILISPFKALVRHVQSKGYPNERFELVTNFPRRKLAHLDYDITLQEAGLCPQETVFVQERN